MSIVLPDGDSFETRYGDTCNIGFLKERWFQVFGYHEAGHAVAALHLGYDVRYTVANPWKRETRIAYPDDREVSPAYYAAGERASHNWMVETGLFTTGNAVAVETTAKHDRKFYGGNLMAIHEAADMIVYDRWGDIVAVAEALAGGDILTGDQIKELTI